MSEAVRELVRRANKLGIAVWSDNAAKAHWEAALELDFAIIAAEAELNRTPQQLHEEAIARRLAEDQAQGVIR